MEARHVLKALKDEGWFLGDTYGPVRQYVHKDRPAVITVCVRYTDELGPETLVSVRTSGPGASGSPAPTDPSGSPPRVVYERTGSGVSAYSPDLPGCVATGESESDAAERMAEAMRLHLSGMRQR